MGDLLGTAESSIGSAGGTVEAVTIIVDTLPAESFAVAPSSELVGEDTAVAASSIEPTPTASLMPAYVEFQTKRENFIPLLSILSSIESSAGSVSVNVMSCPFAENV